MILKAPFMGRSGGVSSEHPLASIAGCQVLREGGNAVDASVSVSLTLAVTQPHLGSIGGDFFALIFESSSGKVHCINSSGWSPRRLNRQLLEERELKGIPITSPHAVVVPGLIDPETGILLNSRASYFNLSGPNRLEPRKRPLHTLSSVIAVSEDNEILSVGTSGGDYRPQQHVLLLTNIIDYGLDLKCCGATEVSVERRSRNHNGGRIPRLEQPEEG